MSGTAVQYSAIMSCAMPGTDMAYDSRTQRVDACNGHAIRPPTAVLLPRVRVCVESRGRKAPLSDSAIRTE
eukprot:623893-Rhodomonas_salina.2